MSLRQRFEEVNKELWLILSVFVIAGTLNFLLSSQRMVLGFYTLPTLYSAYFYGKRHAVLVAIASSLIVFVVVYFNPFLFANIHAVPLRGEKWFDLAVWGGLLVVTAYAMGTLYDHKEARLRELREAYFGILLILRQFIAKDTYTQNHSYRVSIYATKIAAYFGLDVDRIEDVRAAALLHDIGKLEISRSLLYKAAHLTEDEVKEMQRHVEAGSEMLGSVGGSLRRVIPIVLYHHDRFDGSGYHPTQGDMIPLEARIVALADVFDSMTSDRPYRKAMSPLEARDLIAKLSGTDFDPKVVGAFMTAFRKGEMEVPELLV